MLEELLCEEEQIAEEREAEAARAGMAILQLPIRELPTLHPPVTVSLETSVRSAVTVMNTHHVGCVLVEKDGLLCGIFTERDVLSRVVGNEVDPDRTPVSRFMTPAPEVLSADDRTSLALNRMTIGGFRHIPIVDSDGRPLAIVSMRNVIEYMAEVYRAEVLNQPPVSGQVPRTREGA